MTHLRRNILLNLKQSTETTLAYHQAPQRGRAFVRDPAENKSKESNGLAITFGAVIRLDYEV